MTYEKSQSCSDLDFQAAALQGTGFPPGCNVTSHQVNGAAFAVAARVRDARGGLVAGGLTQTGLFKPGQDCKAQVQEVYRKNLATLVSGGVDFLILEFFRHVTELEWAVEACLNSGLPIGAMLCMGPDGEEGGASVEQCAVRVAKAGAHLVGVNCLFDPPVCLTVMARMKEALKEARLDSTYLMAQPVGWRSQSSPSPWSRDRSPDGKQGNGLERLSTWESAT